MFSRHKFGWINLSMATDVMRGRTTSGEPKLVVFFASADSEGQQHSTEIYDPDEIARLARLLDMLSIEPRDFSPPKEG